MGGEWILTRINVPNDPKYRGHRVGSALLEKILQDADSEGVALRLEVSPSDGLDLDQLTAWYVRHGFVIMPDGTLRREPVNK